MILYMQYEWVYEKNVFWEEQDYFKTFFFLFILYFVIVVLENYYIISTLQTF